MLWKIQKQRCLFAETIHMLFRQTITTMGKEVATSSNTRIVAKRFSRCSVMIDTHRYTLIPTKLYTGKGRRILNQLFNVAYLDEAYTRSKLKLPHLCITGSCQRHGCQTPAQSHLCRCHSAAQFHHGRNIHVRSCIIPYPRATLSSCSRALFPECFTP